MKSIDLLRLSNLVNIFRTQGHQIAALDPLAREWGLAKVGVSNHHAVHHWVADPEAERLRTMMQPWKNVKDEPRYIVS